MELKTLKDLKQYNFNVEDNIVFAEQLEQLAIKWVKEDINEEKELTTYELTEKWIKRLNINREDLEEKG